MVESPHVYCESDPVVAQYERWAYPAPIDDLNSPAVSQYLQSYYSLRDLSLAYWPAGPNRQDIDILIAGCGTMAAACVAKLYPACRVVGIDISRTSLAHEQALKQRHNLTNLELYRLPIEEVATLGRQFDYIGCQGVLHHLPDPLTGLRALGSTLCRNGVIALMVYGAHGRSQVYVFQELFRLMGLQQTSADLAIVRETLEALPPEHALKAYLRRADDLNSDAGLVDTFLHRRDRAYTVPDCLKLVRDAGLTFQGWDQNFFYHPEGLFPGACQFRARLRLLPPEQLWQAMEAASGLLAMHWFHACRGDRDPASWQIPWDTPRLLDCVPVRTGQLAQQRSVDGQQPFVIGRPGLLPVLITRAQAAIFSQIDGRRTVRDCLTSAGIPGSAEQLIPIAREFFSLMWRTSNGLLRIPRMQNYG